MFTTILIQSVIGFSKGAGLRNILSRTRKSGNTFNKRAYLKKSGTKIGSKNSLKISKTKAGSKESTESTAI